MTIKDRTAIVGIGRTQYFKRGQSLPMTQMEMAIKATAAALEDAGLTKDDLDGFALYSAPLDPGAMAAQMGLNNLRFAATLTSGGNGSAGAVGLAAAAVDAGMANYVVSLMTLQQANRRLGGTAVGPAPGGLSAIPAQFLSPMLAFSLPASITSPGHNFSMITNRHMHQYGTK
jgi:acetyl-CoA acetyltransferase